VVAGIWPGPSSGLPLSSSPAAVAALFTCCSTAVPAAGWSALVMPAQWQLHGRAAGPIRNRELLEQAIARAVAHSSPGCLTSVLVVAFPGGAGTASLVREARRMASRSPVPIAVVEVNAAAGLCAVPVGVGCS
jgi:hypothetical protein